MHWENTQIYTKVVWIRERNTVRVLKRFQAVQKGEQRVYARIQRGGITSLALFLTNSTRFFWHTSRTHPQYLTNLIVPQRHAWLREQLEHEKGCQKSVPTLIRWVQTSFSLREGGGGPKSFDIQNYNYPATPTSVSEQSLRDIPLVIHHPHYSYNYLVIRTTIQQLYV